MNHTILNWVVLPIGTPHVLRRCPKCGKVTAFCSTEKFRVNAQQKNLDVWLIYACTHCSTTWNMELYSRVAPGSLPAERYDQFLNNDQETPKRYAFDRTVLLKNNAVADYQSVTYEVKGERFDLNLCGRVTVEIECPFFFRLRMNQLLGHTLGLSRKEIHTLFESKVLNTAKGEKAKLQEKTILEYCRL